VSPIVPLPLIDAALRGSVLALLLLPALVLLRRAAHSAVARVTIAMALGLAVQVVSSAPVFEAGVPRVWQAPLVGVSVANAVLFWIFAAALFDDGFRLRAVHVMAWVAAAAVGTLNCAWFAGSDSAWAPFTLALQRLVAPVGAVLAAWAALAHASGDLVEGRRRLRRVLVGVGVVYTLAQLAARMGSPHGQLSQASALVDVIAQLCIAAIAVWELLDLSRPATQAVLLDTTTPAAPAPASAAPPDAGKPDPAEDGLADALRHAMEQQHAYRTENLSIASLAAQLAVPEYRLRRLINQRLGHRNFNAFVNGYRLAEARAALADPAQRALPILSIALESGFRSIGPFNRAFKAEVGCTPSEFRQQHLVDCGIGQPQAAH
jgi:AraC-like DNA-binding protein